MAELASGGQSVISAKIVEEAYELIEAGADREAAPPYAVLHEAADLVFHLLVFLKLHDVAWTDVERTLADRMGVGGLAEKASRKTTP